MEHPGGISSLFFAFADLVIHSIFNTNHDDPTINDASSYLDLSVLYGSNEDQVKSIRKHDGTGMLKPDTFADARLLMMPPAACALLILLNRNHNVSDQSAAASPQNIDRCHSLLPNDYWPSMRTETLLPIRLIRRRTARMMKFSIELGWSIAATS